MAGFLALGLYFGKNMGPGETVTSQTGQTKYQKIQDVLTVLDNRYVDSIDAEALFERSIGDMLHNLDPHSNYIAARDLKAMNEDIRGNFGGVGIRFFIIKDTVCVTNVLPMSPSSFAGLEAGDKIIEVDGNNVIGITNDSIMGQLKGLAGTNVNLKLNRRGNIINKTVTRGTIPVESVVASYMINEETGYIKIDRFSVETSREFRRAGIALKTKGLKKLILDLRNNGGGVLRGATEIADEFLEADIPIVATRGEHSQEYIYKSTSQGMLKDIELVVLLNANSASASEILAGAIQDNDRGTIMGRRSYGKGLVQEDVLLRDGSNLRLTIARYYTPTGRCIQKEYNGDMESYYSEQYDRYDNGEMYNVDSTFFVDSLKFVTPKGKVVYGGGGIMPDVFIPFDSTGSSWYLTQLRYSPAFTTFAFSFVDDKRTQWNSPLSYYSDFTVTAKILQQFVEFAESEYDVKVHIKELNYSKKLIKRYLKAEIARQIWVEQGFYQVINKTDKEVLEAIESF